MVASTILVTMKFPLAEKFDSIQGEGAYTGTPMKFIRFVGCSVGKKICTHCDTSFEKMNPLLGGGYFDEADLIKWIGDYQHVCFTGGEPLDRDIESLIKVFGDRRLMCHIETSGTKYPKLPLHVLDGYPEKKIWICVSPKPGYLPEMIEMADEIKVILHGLGDGEGWPGINDAVQWANEGKLVFIQPRNDRKFINEENLQEAIKFVSDFPELRLSVQLHKFLKTR